MLEKLFDGILSEELQADMEEGISVGRVAEYLGITVKEAASLCKKFGDIVSEARKQLDASKPK